MTDEEAEKRRAKRSRLNALRQELVTAALQAEKNGFMGVWVTRLKYAASRLRQEMERNA